MENKIREHIDSLKNKNLKESVNLEFDKISSQKTESVQIDEEMQLKGRLRKRIKENLDKKYEYRAWLDKVFLQNLRGAYFPSNQDENDLFKLLNLEVIFKRTFKSACDDEHPIVAELLEDLQVGSESLSRWINAVKSIKPEPLAFYKLFQEELESANFRLDGVCRTIDKLSKDSRHGTIVSHPAKMTNPECKYPKLFVSHNNSPDGYLRTGNSKAAFDMHINAVNLRVFKFLSLLYNQKPLLEHIKNNNSQIFKELLGVSDQKAKAWIKDFSACFNNQNTNTNQFVKQVYFPVENQYHLLSLLTPSGLVFSLKEKIDTINYNSPLAYLGKKLRKANKYSDTGYSTMPNLAVTRHGGEHPKNISGLNNKFQSYYLLHSVPPKIQKRGIQFPKRNFFKDSFPFYKYREVFNALHRLFKTEYNNKRIREGRDYRLQDLMDRIIDRMWAVRSVCRVQYRQKDSQLIHHQRVWLCEEYRQIREEEDAWLEKLCNEIAAWTIRTYEQLLGKQAYKLDESVRQHVLKIVTSNMEALR